MTHEQEQNEERNILARFWYLHAIIDWYRHIGGKKIHDNANIFYSALLEYEDMIECINAIPRLPKFKPSYLGVNTLKTARNVVNRMDGGKNWTSSLAKDVSVLLFNIENYFCDLRGAKENADRHLDIDAIEEAGQCEATVEHKHALLQ